MKQMDFLSKNQLSKLKPALNKRLKELHESGKDVDSFEIEIVRNDPGNIFVAIIKYTV